MFLKSLAQWLWFIDSLYASDTHMRDVVLAKEDQKRRDIELIQRAIDMEKEVRKLKQQVKKGINKSNM